MRNVELAALNSQVHEMEVLYGRFDIGRDGLPTPNWVHRNLALYRFDGPMRHAFFPDVYVHKVPVNRRMRAALGVALREIGIRWTREAQRAHGLDQFKKCYCFGDGVSPNLHWYGAAWELGPEVGGGVLDEVIDIFVRAGFTRDKKRLRTFEYW